MKDEEKQTKKPRKKSKSCQIHYSNTQEISFLYFPSLLPPPHYLPISPAVQDGHAWWRPSQGNWPGPMAPAYWWENPLLGQSDRSPAGFGTPRQSRAGSRSRWSVWSFSSRVPPDSPGLQNTVNRGKKTMNEQRLQMNETKRPQFRNRKCMQTLPGKNMIKSKQKKKVYFTHPPTIISLL